jgi:hypothetical protein
MDRDKGFATWKIRSVKRLCSGRVGRMLKMTLKKQGTPMGWIHVPQARNQGQSLLSILMNP